MIRRTVTLVPLLLLCCSCSSSSSGATFADGTSDPSAATSTQPGNSNDTGGFGPSAEGGASTSGESYAPSTLTAIVRDFRLYNSQDPTTNADFEDVPNDGTNGPWDDRGIVGVALGSDGTPVYANASAKTLTTHGQAPFAQWYHDVAGTNIHVEIPLALTTNADGSVGYDSEQTGVMAPGESVKGFFPINDGTPYATAFGNQGQPENYSFTVEIHTVFTYGGGETFEYRGDDDVWVFINKQRVIDLGGVHSAETASVSIDSLSLSKGTEYPLDVFFAERHKTGSDLLFTTSLELRPATPH